MKIKAAAAVVAGLLLCACSRENAPKIGLDEKLKCGALVEARATNDTVTYGNLWELAFRAAQRNYNTDTEIQAYFLKSVLADAGLSLDVQRTMYQQCAADSDLAIATSFRRALDQSFEQNKNSPLYGVCRAFDEGRISIDSVMALVIAKEGKLNTPVDPNDPRIPVYQNALKQQCSADPASLLVRHISSVTGDLERQDRQARRQEEERARQELIAGTAALATKLRAEMAANKALACTDMSRLKSDENPESRAVVEAVMQEAIDSTLKALPLEQAAFTRQNIERAAFGIDFRECVQKEGTMADAVGKYNWTLERPDIWIATNTRAIENEKAKRGQVAPDPGADPMTEEQQLELQMERAARVDEDEARLKQDSSK